MKLRTRILVTLWLALCTTAGWAIGGDVTLEQGSNKRNCTIRNDYISVYINSDGEITSLIRYLNNDRDFEHSVQLISGSGVKGYFSFATSGSNTNYSISAFYVKQNSSDVVELQYVTNWNDGIRWMIHYIVTRDVPGVYNYVQVEGSASAKELSEARMGLRCDPSLINYAYVNDDLQAEMPTPAQLKVGADGGCTVVADATYLLANGTVYTKYDNAAFQKDDQMHGMMGNNIGVWTISPSMEWINGGVMRQDLTVHATDSSPILLRHFHGNHFGGTGVTFGSGLTKLYGPHLLYVNQSTAADVTTAHNEMIADAKAQAATEIATFPNYSWMRDENIKKRGTVTGQLTLGSDIRYFGTTKLQVILAKAGVKPMLQGKDYQFWAETDEDGHFTIGKVRPGTYSLWAYALNGSATGYYEKTDVTVTNGETTDLGQLTWTPDKYGENSKILWQIGTANHLSSGYNLSGAPRAYGRWNQVPAEVNYTIGSSDPATDWYYAQAHNGNWFIKYYLDEVPSNPLRLTVATAGTANVSMKVRSNENTSTYGVGLGNAANEVFRPQHDGSVTRSATLAGRDSLAVFYIPTSSLHVGENYLNLNVWGIPEGGGGGIMYDCIKLESNEVTTPVLAANGAQLDFSGETSASTLTTLTNYNNTGFFLRAGESNLAIAVNVPGRDTRTFTFSDGSGFSGQNSVTLSSQNKNDYSNNPKANGEVVEKSRLNIGFRTPAKGKIYIAYQAIESSPAAGSLIRLAMNGSIVASASLPTAADKTNRCDVLEYEASEAGTFFIDGYGGRVKIYCVKYVPAGVQVDMPSAGWSTFCSDRNCTLPEGLEAYIVSGTNDSEAVLIPVTDIPASTGVLLKGSMGSYSLPFAGSATAVTTNLLVACLTEQTVSEPASGSSYVLVKDNTTGDVYFSKIGASSATVPAGKAYLHIPTAGAPALSFTFGAPTGMKTLDYLTTSPSDHSIYDLSGRQLSNSKWSNGQITPGLYIVNGRKVIVK